MKSIRTKLIVLVLVFIIAGMGGLSFLSYSKTKNIVAAELEHSITLVAKSSGSEVAAWIGTRKSEMALLANSTIIKSGNKKAIINYLNSEIQRSNVYETFYIADPKGKAYTTSGESLDLGDRDYFKKALETGQVIVSDPFISEASGKPTIVVAAPIIINGTANGVIGGALQVDDLSSMLSLVKVGQTGYAYLVRGDGLYITHQNSELAMKYNPLSDSKADPSLVEATRQMIRGQEGVVRYISDGKSSYLAYSKIPEVNWILAVTAPVDELSGQISSLPMLYLGNTLIVSIVIAVALIIFLRRMFINLRLVTGRAIKIADGDLTENELVIKAGDEMGLLAGAFNSLLNNLKEITVQLQEKAKNVSSSANVLMTSAEHVTAGATETASTISQIASAVEKVTKNSRQIAESSEKASNHARESREGIKQIIGQMDAIQKAAESSSQVINGLNHSAGKITRIVEMITQIADQTNLLALNAAIEAARAGEHGQGFAVVAEEVRTLSEQSANAANSIHALITAIQQESGRAVHSMVDGAEQVNAGSNVVKEVGGSLEQIIMAVQGLADEIQSIATAIGEISSSVENVAAAAREQTASMEEVSSTTEHLAAMAGELEALSNRFRL